MIYSINFAIIENDRMSVVNKYPIVGIYDDIDDMFTDEGIIQFVRNKIGPDYKNSMIYIRSINDEDEVESLHFPVPDKIKI